MDSREQDHRGVQDSSIEVAAASKTHARWVATILAALCPGLGHVYNRQYGKGFVFNILSWGTGWLTFLVARETAMAPFNLVLAAPWIPVFYCYQCRDAFVAARHTSSGVPDVKRRWPRYLAAVSLLLTSNALGQTSSSYLPLTYAVVVGEAMAPALVDGERILLDLHVYDDRLPDPGDIVAFEVPGNRARSLVQRCIAIEGQIVTIENGVVYVDGIRFDEPEGVQPSSESLDPQIVPDGHVFVMGDNRRTSSDSRSWGPVPRDHVLGKAVQKLLARDADTGAIRLERTGEVLD